MNNHGNAKTNDIKTMIIPVFIMNNGCPHRCIFCNQKITAGNYPARLTKDIFDAEVKTYLCSDDDKKRKVEIAFYGGNFTGLSRICQEKLLSWANFYIREGLVHALRISTRPDYISDDILKLLKENNVTTVELGAQSFVDDVLEHAQRGHNAACIEQAMELLKKYSFQTSLHLMAGLPKDTQEGFFSSLEKTIQLRPDMARINPTLVLRDTLLADQYLQGGYVPLNLSEAIDLCRLALEKLSAAGIRIIRFGLHLSDEMKKEGAVLAGPSHPSFGGLVLSSCFYSRTLKLLENIPQKAQEIIFYLSCADVSAFRGLSNRNISAMQSLYPRTKIIIKPIAGQKRGDIALSVDSGNFINAKILPPFILSQGEAHQNCLNQVS